MIRHPRPGDRVQVWYAKDKVRRCPELYPWHGKVGIVARVGRGPTAPLGMPAIRYHDKTGEIRGPKFGPLNVGVRIDGVSVVFVRGNLRPAEG